MTFEPRCEKTGLRGFRPGPTQTGLYNYRRWLEAWNFVYRKKRDCTIYVAKTKALISFAVTAKLICVFVFAYAKIRFSHDAAHFMRRCIKHLHHSCLTWSETPNTIFTRRLILFRIKQKGTYRQLSWVHQTDIDLHDCMHRVEELASSKMWHWVYQPRKLSNVGESPL